MRSTAALGFLTVMGAAPNGPQNLGNAGVSGLWVLANICYAGMRAQDNPDAMWRVVSFIFGFPGTLVSMLVVEEGSERAYGVDRPRSNRAQQPKSVPPDFDV